MREIPLSAPDITEAEIDAVVKVLRSPRLSLGPVLAEFERSTAEYVDAAYAVAVNSGTSALHLAMLALGIAPEDEVIVPSFSFVAVANVVRYVGAKPVFADIDPITLNLDPAKVEAAITPRTRAILVVHTFGVPAEMTAILDIARRHHLRVIEDACEALGAEYGGKKVGPLGDAGVFAFYPNKQITTGEGGMLVTNNGEIATAARALRNQGRRDSDDWFQHSEVGYNYRISEMNCALGVEQMKRIETILARREQVASQYRQRLAADSRLILPAAAPANQRANRAANQRISWFVYVLRLSPQFTHADRDGVMKDLAADGIASGRYFAPIHLQPAYRSFRNCSASLAVTESESARCIALPFYNRITEDDVERVCDSLLRSLDRRPQLSR
ncbi:MAG TPA: DegT/DnrJ/EryC1/StrS family aminotransferase [Acidisarcina sp.]|nr:DegT/DnrJ/EryC1/StrS family aminotransferase [Acidisarcina sp.]